MNKKRLIYSAVATALAISACSTQIGTPPATEGNLSPNDTFSPRDSVKGAANIRKDKGAVALEHDRMEPARRDKVEFEGKGTPSLARDSAVAVGTSVSSPTMNSPTQRSQTSLDFIRPTSEHANRENYAHFDDNGIFLVAEQPVSTFSVDVDTGTYSNVRRMLNAGALPAADAIRVEELINYFDYAYPVPADRSVPFRVTSEVGANPWNSQTHLIHIGLKGYEIPKQERPPSNLVFLVDVSGSMNAPDKLDLLKTSLKMLTRTMGSEDRISIVVYAGASGVVLEPTPANQMTTIGSALDRLTAGGSTNGGAGIELAYSLAQQAYVPNGNNRIILATDGDFNVGTTHFEALKQLVTEKRKTDVSLTTLGFGTGNYNDHLMEQLADAGNGNYAYIDNLNEARKVLVDQSSSTLQTIAKDVKIQIEFNPNVVSEYRLVGYENRALAREDFNNDNVDAGDIGAGHTVTAIYEVALVNRDGARIDRLRYQDAPDRHSAEKNDEIAFVRLRYKAPDGDKSALIESAILLSGIRPHINQNSEQFVFAAAVAGFGQLLRGGKFTEKFGFDDVLELARHSKGKDPFGYRGEFVQLVSLAQSLSTTNEVAAKTPTPVMSRGSNG